MPVYQGSCHCGAVRFAVDTVITSVLRCNCSICRKKGVLHHRVTPAQMTLLSGEDALADYRFGTGAARHTFCRTCGIHPFSRPRAAPELYTINVNTLDDYDLDREKPAVVDFDGRNWEQAVSTLSPAAGQGKGIGQ